MRLRTMLAATTALSAIAFDNDSGWKKDATGKIETDSDGNPIYITDDGAETSVKYETAVQLRGEAKNYRTRAETAEKALKKFDGLDPDAARAAVEKLKDVDLDKLVSSDKLDEVKAQMRQQFEKQINDANAERDATRQENNNLRLDNAFKGSNFLNERLAIPKDAAEALFRNRFKVEDGKVVPTDTNGEPLYSKKNAGEIASVDEAFEYYVTSRPDKDTLLKAPDASGSGNNGGGGNRGGGSTMKRSDFDALDQGQQAQIGQRVAKGEMQIVD